MDLSNASTESMLRFHRFHERLNRSIKVQAIGLGLLADEIEAGTSPHDIKERLYARPGWLWGGMPDWTGAREDVEAAIRDIGQNGVVRAFSAFDLYLDDLLAELTSWHDFSGVPASTHAAILSVDDDADRAERVYLRLGATRTRVSHLWPVYRYFRQARNCIAHREGIASRALVESYEVPEIQSTLDRWIERTGEMTAPMLVPVKQGEQLEFTHRQSIAASSILRLIALDLGRLMIGALGDAGFVYLAVRRAFFESPPLPEIHRMSTMPKVLNEVMSNRYRVRGYDKVEGLRVLRALNLTKRCSARFAAIKSKLEMS